MFAGKNSRENQLIIERSIIDLKHLDYIALVKLRCTVSRTPDLYMTFIRLCVSLCKVSQSAQYMWKIAPQPWIEYILRWFSVSTSSENPNATTITHSLCSLGRTMWLLAFPCQCGITRRCKIAVMFLK